MGWERLPVCQAELLRKLRQRYAGGWLWLFLLPNQIIPELVNIYHSLKQGITPHSAGPDSLHGIKHSKLVLNYKVVVN